MSITPEEYFNNDSMRVNIFKSKYATSKGDVDVDVCFGNIAKEASNVSIEDDSDVWATRWTNEMIDGNWRSGGSIISGLNNPDKNISVFNCTTFFIEDDTLESIYNTRYEAAKSAAHRQGLGVEFSKVRPKGSSVNNSADFSEGAVNWMKSINSIAHEVGQRGRLPALLGSLKVNHPDIEEFITVKNDLETLQNMNISVQVTNDFMDAVKNNTDWELYFDINKKDGSIDRISKIVKAKELYRLICKQSHKWAEPALQFIDQMRSHSLQEAFGYEITSTNACITADSNLLTKNGIRELRDVEIGDVIWSGKEWTTVIDKWSNGTKNTYSYITNGGAINSTSDHPIYNEKNEKIEVGKSSNIQQAIGDQINIEFDKQAIIDGILYGSCISTIYANSRYKPVRISDGDDSYEMFMYHLTYEECIDSIIDPLTGVIISDLTKGDIESEEVPFEYFRGDNIAICSFLRGFLTTTARLDSRSIILSLPSIKTCQQIQLMLSAVGIKSELLRGINSAQLKITNNLDVFYEQIGFMNKAKNSLVYDACNRNERYPKTINNDIHTVNSTGVNEVFDITVDCDDHTFWCNGLLISNCSEKSLPNRGVCALASLNMGNVPAITDKDNFHSYMESNVTSLVRFMDNVIQYEIDNPHKSPLESQLKVVKDLREIGLGVTNVHQWLYNQNLAYDSDDAANVMEEFFKWYQYYAFNASCDLAETRGACPAYYKAKDDGILKETEFLKIVFSEFPDLKEKFYKTGIRNGALLSVAPTGCRLVDSKFQTDKGNKSLKDIFIEQGFDYKSIENNDFNEKKWFAFDEPIMVRVGSSLYKECTNFYYNGREQTKTIEFEDGKSEDFSIDHRLLLNNDGVELWVKVKDLNVGDCIASLDNNKIKITGIKHNIEPVGTWDIEVPDYNYYYLENGVCSHNSISMTFPEDCLSSGIEPAIGYAYWRRTRAINKGVWEYYFVLPSIIKRLLLEKMDNDGYDGDDKTIIENFSGSEKDEDGKIGKEIIDIVKKWINVDLLKPAHEINPFQKAKMMGKIQRWIDAAISVTYNLDEDIPVDDIGKLYMDVYDRKLKAISIYREGSREGVLIFESPAIHKEKYRDSTKLNSSTICNDDNLPKDIVYQCPPKRPDILECDIHHASVKGEQWIVIVGLFEGKPFELFAGKKNDEFNISKSITSGKIVKNKKRYNLRVEYKNGSVDYNNIPSLFMNVEYEALTRLISLSLQNGVYHSYIVKQLKKSSAFVSDFMAVCSRVLTKYITNDIIGTNSGSDCPKCGTPMRQVGGCLECMNCNYSKCE